MHINSALKRPMDMLNCCFGLLEKMQKGPSGKTGRQDWSCFEHKE